MAKKPKDTEERKPLPKSIIQALPAAYTIFRHLNMAELLLHKELQPQLDEAARDGAVQAARAFVVLDRLKKSVDDFSKVVNAVYEGEKASRVPLAIESEGLNTVPLKEEGFRITNRIALRASIIPDAKTEAYAWMRENNMGGLITESVNASSLSSDMSYLINEENREPPPGLFNLFFAVTASVTATKTKNG